MKKFQSKNYHLPTSDDLNDMQARKEQAIKDRGADLLSWGILRANAYPASVNIPASSTNPAPNLRQAIGEFTLTFDTDLGLLSVGVGSDPMQSPPIVGGVAYDLNWERIAILADAAFDFDNNIPEGKRSSGNLNIPLTLTGTSGGAGSNASQLGTYYVWIEYLGVNDVSAPKVDRLGNLFWPKIDDGYKIVLTGTPVAPNGDGISVFLCKLVWAASFPEIITLTDGEETRTNGNSISTIPADVVGEPKRVYCMARQQAVEVIPDSTLRPANYAEGERHSLQDHVSAIGSSAPNPRNPHGTTLDDIPGGTAEPKATTNLKESLADGLLDFADGNNSPRANSDAALPTIEQNSLVPANLNATTVLGTGIDSTVKDAWIRISDLGADQVAYLTGIRLKRLYPSLRETSDHTSDPSINPLDPDSGDGWIGFSNAGGGADPAGTYRLFGQPGVLNGQDVLLLRKELLGGYPSVIPPLARGLMPLGQVYWDGNDLFRDSLKAQVATNTAENRPIDERTLGMVGPEQLSTYLKEQSLAGQTFQNLLGNSNFMFNKVATQFPGWVIDDSAGAAYLPNASILQLLAATDPLLVSGGPGALFGTILTPVAGQTTGTTKFYGQLAYLKPNTTYSIAFWYRADNGWTSRLRVGINQGVAGPNSVLTTGSPFPGPLDAHVIDDGLYHRAILTVKTNAAVNPDPANTFHLLFQLDATATPTVAGKALRITNVQVTEGEWVPGYDTAVGRTIPAGGNIFFDDRSSCPPGWVENTNLRGRMPLGYVPGGSNGVQTPGTLLGTQVTNGLVHTDTEQDTISVGRVDVQGGSGANIVNAVGADGGSGTGTTNGHAHTTGLTVGLWCRAL